MLQTVIFIGRSGCGKGTQAELLKKYLEKNTPQNPVLHIETGDYFRKYIKEAGDTWDRARKIMELGGRHPDFLAVWMWTTAFIENFHGNEHLIFDGAPRALPEAKILDTAFPFYDRLHPTIAFLNVSEKWAEERLHGRGRADDVHPEVIARRLAYFTKDVTPAIEYYRVNPAYRFLDINGEQSPEKVFQDVLRGLGLN